jgi:hypothetical protein
MSGLQKYAIACPPAWHTLSFGAEMAELSPLVAALGNPEAGALHTVYEQALQAHRAPKPRVVVSEEMPTSAKVHPSRLSSASLSSPSTPSPTQRPI